MNEIIYYLFLPFSLISDILISLVHFTDMKGIELVECCKMKLKNKLM